MPSLLIIALLIGLITGAVFFTVLHSFTHLSAAIPNEDREYLDPLPSILRMVWPVVRFIDFHVCSILPQRLLNAPAEALKLSGLLYLLSPSQFVALSLFSMTVFVLITWITLSAIDMMSFQWALGVGLLGYFYPRIWLKDLLKKRQKLILKSLPAYLDFLTMGVEAGLNMAGAISQAVVKGPAGPLKNEFALVLRDLRAGLTRADALRRMDDRVRIREVSSFVNAVIQAERMGASLGSTFRYQAEQRRVERFQRAEKLAMEAPVKLIFPLVAFIFPITFLVLMFPIAIKFMQSGFQ